MKTFRAVCNDSTKIYIREDGSFTLNQEDIDNAEDFVIGDYNWQVVMMLNAFRYMHFPKLLYNNGDSESLQQHFNTILNISTSAESILFKHPELREVCKALVIEVSKEAEESIAKQAQDLLDEGKTAEEVRSITNRMLKGLQDRRYRLHRAFDLTINTTD